MDLQHGFAATVPTLTRIGAKLKPQGDEIGEAAGATAKETNDDGIPDKGSSSTGSDGVSGKGRICSFCKVIIVTFKHWLASRGKYCSLRRGFCLP